MKHGLVFAALAVVLIGSAARGNRAGHRCAALPVPPAAGPATPTAVPAPAAVPGALPPEKIAAIVRSIGLHPLGPPAARGPTYVLRAADRRAEIVRVVVDARSGEILSVMPVVEGPRGIRADGPPPPIRPGARVEPPGAEVPAAGGASAAGGETATRSGSHAGRASLATAAAGRTVCHTAAGARRNGQGPGSRPEAGSRQQAQAVT